MSSQVNVPDKSETSLSLLPQAQGVDQLNTYDYSQLSSQASILVGQTEEDTDRLLYQEHEEKEPNTMGLDDKIRQQLEAVCMDESNDRNVRAEIFGEDSD